MPDFLPKDFRFSHNFAFFLHDMLAGMIVEGEKADIFNVSFKFQSEDEATAFGNLNHEELWEWLATNDKLSHYTLIYKQICLALLSDFCHFVYEGLQCSKKGKLSVAYSLLRKPFKDNLLIFEWLLAEPADFIEKFYNEDPSVYAPQKLSPERKLKLISAALQKTNSCKSFEADFIYDLRYSRTAQYGLARAWDQATHLVTTFEQIKTTPQNFNFVFRNHEAEYSQWQGLYTCIPYLLFYTVGVVEAVIATFATRADAEGDMFPTRAGVGFALWTKSVRREKSQSLDFLMEPLDCPYCDKKISFGLRNMKALYERSEIKCYSCKAVVCI